MTDPIRAPVACTLPLLILFTMSGLALIARRRLPQEHPHRRRSRACGSDHLCG
jgi:hypothetical protein